jgi:exodeoxyribonuclease VII, large subunit
MFNIDEVYTVSDFLSLCNKTIENNIPTCWLQGEISNLSRPASGHWYFSLKDNRGQIRCALFRLNQRNIKFNPENGMEVLVRAAPTLYEARGDFQIIIQHIEPVGVGNLQLAFEQLKNQLKDEGLFDTIHKKPLPSEVSTIGVISSSNGAVIRDIIKILNKRYPFANILLFDCAVQGEGSAQKLAQAIEAADQSNRCDVMIIARGGGSLEDLWAFNEEALVRAIFNTKTPIISAVGHETDTTIADFVSDVRAPTPSAAAMIVAPDRLELLSNANKLYAQLHQLSNQILEICQHKFSQLKSRIPTPSRQLHLFSQQLDSLSSRLNYQTKTVISLNQGKLITLFEQLKQHSPIASIQHKKEINALSKYHLAQQIHRLINQNSNTLHALNERLKKSINALVEMQINQLSSQISGLNHLSPLNTLSRGYSITSTDNNQVLLSKSTVKIGSSIITQLTDGKIYSKVNKIENN